MKGQLLCQASFSGKRVEEEEVEEEVARYS